jgi:hypothetical protein
LSSSVVVFEPYPKQKEFIEAVFSGKYSFLCYGGSMGGGKSYVSLAVLIMLCRMFPGSKWCVIRESLPTIKRTTLPSFKKVLPDNFLKGYNQQENIATFMNGSQILFMAEDYANDKDFDRFKGLEVNGFLLEQLEELQESLLDVCTIRAGRHKLKGQSPPPLILATINPTLTWAKDKIYLRYINGMLPEDWFYLPASIFDNPALSNDKAYMDRLKNLDPLTYARHIDGDWNAFAVDKPFMYCFDEKKHIKEVEYNPRDTVYLSFDFNVDPITCTAWQLGRDFIHGLFEFRLRNSNLYELCDVIKSTLGDTHLVITGDASGLSRHVVNKGNVNNYTVILKELGVSISQLRVPKSNPPINESRTLSNSIFARHPNVCLHPRMKYLIQDNRFVQVKEDGSIDKTKDAHMGHLLDTERYLFNSFKHDFILKQR